MKKGENMQKTYLISERTVLEQLLKKVEKIYTSEEFAVKSVRESYFETFDWRLFDRGWILKRKGRQLTLCQVLGDKVLAGGGSMRKKFFSWDIQKSELRAELFSLADIRAVLELFEHRYSRRSFAIMNKDGKTVARISVDDGYVLREGQEKEFPLIVTLSCLRGYGRQYNRVDKLFSDAEEAVEITRKQLFDRMLRAVRLTPGDYSSQYNLTLDEKLDVQGAVSEICRYLLATMEKNYNGVIDDIDSECLHDFRVAMRRTRSLLSQLKKNIPVTENRWIQNELRWLGSITGPVRDIDVYLLEQDRYLSMVPERLRQGVTFFFEDLAKNRKRAFKEMVDGLKSQRYTDLMVYWNLFINEKEKGTCWAAGEVLCKKKAAKIIGKRFQKIVDNGRAIDDNSPDEMLHKLRIQGKKLRYLLEFFRAFYNADEITLLLKQLKKLQNNLGTFNDISVQKEMITQAINGLNGRNKRTVQIGASLGGLLTHLHDEHRIIRKAYEETFASFASDENIARFSLLLS